MLKKLLSILTSRWLVTLVGALALAAIVWFLGPLFAFADARPFEDQTVRLVAVFVILLVWALSMQWSLARQRAANERVVEALAEATAPPKADPDQEVGNDEIDLLRQRLREAMARLKRTRFGGRWDRRYLYQLPWYLLIGAPGSGKTTALMNSGLRFPLASEMGRTAVRDLGGTRNCDWWFTDEAVLIDTAGRYTTQDSRQSVDGRVWTGFLDLLKKHRPRQPINGALMAVSLSDLLVWNDADRAQHALTLKRRLQELRTHMGVRFPVYVLLTKADLLAGFNEYFESLGREERDQVWGMTLPMDDGAGEEAAVRFVGPEFDALVGRLNRRLLDRMHQEPDMARRSLDFLFPAQVALLRPALLDFLALVFEPNRFEERPLLRGVYFTSGTQDGVPLDRLTGGFADSFGIERPTLPPFVGQGRSFFIARLLREVVFPEANLAGTDLPMEKRRRLVRRVATGGAVAASVAVAGFWAVSNQGNHALLDKAETATAAAAQALKPLNTAPLSLSRVSDTDFATIVPGLNALRTLPGGWLERGSWPPLELTGGLYQGTRIGRQADTLYVRALRTVLLSRVFLRLEEQVRRERSRPDYLYQALKVYLMLGGQGPLDKELVVDWMALDWLATLPGPFLENTRNDLRTHMEALMEAKFAPIPLDEGLVREARVTLGQYPLAERGFDALRNEEALKALPDWRLVDKAGPLSTRALYRPSGKPLSEGVPGLYTYDAFHGPVMDAIPAVAGALVGEGWVLGQPTLGPDAVNLQNRLQKDILALYLNEYGRRWDELLGDVAIVPFRSLSHAADVLNALSGPDSPLKRWMTAVVRETTLVPGPQQPAAGQPGAASGPGAAALNQVNQAQRNLALGTQNLSALARIAGVQVDQGGPPPGQVINDRFQALRDYAKSENGQPSKLDDTIKQLGDLYQQVARAANAPDQNSALLANLSGGDRGQLVAAMKATARNLPPPVGGMVAGVAQASTTIAVGGAKNQINQVWTSTVLPLCKAALDNRFPMVRNSPVDVAPADFVKLFAPGGLIDQFFNANLKPFVDTSQSPWKFQKVDDAALGMSTAALEQFERAAKIRDGLFPPGATAPKVVFEITPVELDARATQVVFDVDGQSLGYQHGPPRPVIMKWPGGDGPSTVRLSFGPPLAGQPAGVVRTGPWSLFRFLADQALSRTDQPDRFTLTVTVGDRRATFSLRADSINNPFSSNLMESFRCPPSL
ncbi:type VI secretion system membrane subunit TssM [Azospirillum sp. RWY-5-1]|uniref:Type VI secretion system membrane subunit TssM n=1 Tax=Azospirillum oleiclasticum TaxID=2735135 RepID=A0ABX2TEN5_9PROT|nr:type VI secretion system membrane subunit TssM [Azospirillum oleiclasticum]NYZ14119.1 type VI secretion system membrane subunit TssM [Azospirillum oleiclasticum]NYZ21603.1 type VI secretion system membrane subunit TssM [Azospirillum oleiclasticum]